MIYVILLYALFASVFTVAKSGLEYTQPLFLVGSRMFLAGALMIGYQWFYNRSELVFNKRSIWRVARLALFNIYLTNACEFWGLKYLTSFKTCFIYSLSPFLSALLCYVMFSEKMSMKKVTGLVIGFVGLAPILLSQTNSEELTGQLFIFSWAELAVIFAVFCSVYGWILLSQLVKEDGIPPITANGFSMLIGGLFALTHSWFVETWDPLPFTDLTAFLQCAIALLIVSNLICYNLYGFLLKRYSATFISLAGFTTPFFTALFGWLYLGEEVTLSFFLSAAIVFFGLLLFYQEELKQGFRVAVKPTPVPA